MKMQFVALESNGSPRTAQTFMRPGRCGIKIMMIDVEALMHNSWQDWYLVLPICACAHVRSQ